MYAHIFASMYQGSMTGKTNLLLVFPCLLAHSDAAGNVSLHPRSIASMTGLTEDAVKAALIELEAEDPESYTRDEVYGGKRIVRLDEGRAWGWFVVNYRKYRGMMKVNTVREQARIRQANKRKRDADRSEREIPT